MSMQSRRAGAWIEGDQMDGVRKYLFLGGVPLVIGAAAFLGVVVANQSVDQLAALEPAVSPVTMPIQPGITDFNSPGTLVLTPGARAPILNSGSSGTITEVNIVAEQELSPGVIVFRVNGVGVMSYQGETVFFRDLSRSSRGSDVKELQRLLNDFIGADLEADGIFGVGTANAVKDLETKLGIGKPSGIFRPGMVIRIPESQYVIDETKISLGGVAPGEGAELFTGAPKVISAVMSGEVPGPSGEYEFIFQGSRLPIVRGGDEVWSAGLGDAAQFLSAEMTEVTKLEGRTQLLGAAESQLIPGAGLITDGVGNTCVAIGMGTEFDVRAVEVIGADVSGAAHVVPVLDPSTQVLVNPAQILGVVSCPSS